MAKKSKTQRAKASAARQARKAQAAAQEVQVAADTQAESSQDSKEEKKGFFKSKAKSADNAKPEVKSEKKKSDKPKKQRFKFFHDVKAEMKRVTWPTRQEVLRWTGVVVVALVFFGVFVAILDNLIITPLMVGLSGIGA